MQTCMETVLSKYQITSVISGTAKGADALGERWAQENDISISRKPADWKTYGKKAGFLRNTEMAEEAGSDGLLCAFWDGKSKGTKHMIDIAKSKGLTVLIFSY